MLQARALLYSRRNRCHPIRRNEARHIVIQLIDSAIVVAVSSQTSPCLVI